MVVGGWRENSRTSAALCLLGMRAMALTDEINTRAGREEGSRGSRGNRPGFRQHQMHMYGGKGGVAIEGAVTLIAWLSFPCRLLELDNISCLQHKSTLGVRSHIESH